MAAAAALVSTADELGVGNTWTMDTPEFRLHARYRTTSMTHYLLVWDTGWDVARDISDEEESGGSHSNAVTKAPYAAPKAITIKSTEVRGIADGNRERDIFYSVV